LASDQNLLSDREEVFDLMPTRFRYPTGVRPLLVEEAAKRRAIERRVVERLEGARYDEVVLPIIDFVDPYSTLLDREVARQSYRFVDRDGELVAIRSDFTPMIARALAPVMTSDDLPLRVFYRGDVIRCEATRLGANRELFQIGAEIVGDDSPEADREMLTLAAAIVRDFGLTPTVVYNDASIIETLIASAPGIRGALVAKRITNGEVPDQLRGIVERLISGQATLDDVAPFAPGAARRLAEVRAELGEEFVLQLDDVDERPGYYTGVRFRVYAVDARGRAAGSRTRVAQGGRYDKLYERFGTPAAAIGFTFTIDDLQP
jgi:ATP phosphoribosyltransferase regulatory subunit